MLRCYPVPITPHHSDSTLRYALNRNCAQDISDICKVEKVQEQAVEAVQAMLLKTAKALKVTESMSQMPVVEGVQKCLSNKYTEIRVPACKDEVMRNMRIVLKSFSMNPSLSGPCKEDTEKFCSKVPVGGGRMQDCLRNHYDLLSGQCQDAEFKVRKKLEVLEALTIQGASGQEVRFGESAASSSISLSGPLAMAGVVSMGILIAAGVVTLVRRLRLRSKGYTVVTMDKGG